MNDLQREVEAHVRGALALSQIEPDWGAAGHGFMTTCSEIVVIHDRHGVFPMEKPLFNGIVMSAVQAGIALALEFPQAALDIQAFLRRITTEDEGRSGMSFPGQQIAQQVGLTVGAYIEERAR